MLIYKQLKRRVLSKKENTQPETGYCRASRV
nr:MAG TPA: hypothetical protein [Caudoviricetes sp.]DAX51759.1 MAG TPA: hypothetical protein [Caudoviricetes sp.]